MPKPPFKMTFGDGYILDAQTVCLASRSEDDLDNDTSRLSVIKGDLWTCADFDDVVISVACIEQERLALFLGYNGKILTITLPREGRGPRTIETIPFTDELGNFLRIRNIRGTIYVVGMSGQVYRRSGKSWVPIDFGIRGEEGLDFEDIGGTSDENLYAVASSGDVCHFDGKRWSKLDFPTNRPLSGVRCFADDDIYICGDDGNLFHGSLNQWQFIGDLGIEDNFWAVEKFDDKLYVAYDQGLLAHDGVSLAQVNIGVGGAVDGYRLHSNDGVLWSFGEEHVVWFDGIAWHRVA